MDLRIREHADVIADYSTEIEAGDHVIISAPPEAEDLVVALYELCGERDAKPLWLGASDRAMRARLRAADPEAFTLSEHSKELFDNADVLVGVRAAANATERSDVDPDVATAYAKTHEEIQDIVSEKRWVGTQFPAPGNAQLAEMSTEAYEEFVWNAVNKDWDAQREFQAQLVEIVDPAEEVRIVSGSETDLTMSVAGMNAVNDDGHKNLPGGEVFTAPVPDSVEGTVLFDKPLVTQGREVRDVFLRFEGGEVTEHAAERNEDVLTAALNADEGARRLGELGIGTNRDIDRFTYNMLFDEKMGDTVHLAIGRAIDECVPERVVANESAIHLDMIVDMSEESFVEVDGDVVQRDGTFRFEAGFEG